MNWRDAYLKQAQSDRVIFDKLNEATIEYCHRLHYLQMMSEKLARGFLASPNAANPPQPTHAGLIKLLQHIKGRSDIRQRMGFSDRDSFRTYIESLLDIALQVQSLAPAIAKFTRPNPEYPWRPFNHTDVIIPAEYDFPDLNPNTVQLVKLVQLLTKLIAIAP